MGNILLHDAQHPKPKKAKAPPELIQETEIAEKDAYSY